jgi:hypothetical protein
MDGWEKMFGGSWVLWPLYAFGCISAVVVKGVSVRYCRGLGVCMVSEVD